MTEQPPKKHFYKVPDLTDASREEILSWASKLHKQILEQFQADEEESADSSSENLQEKHEQDPLPTRPLE